MTNLDLRSIEECDPAKAVSQQAERRAAYGYVALPDRFGNIGGVFFTVYVKETWGRLLLISFAKRKLEQEMNDDSRLIRSYGTQQARKIRQRLDDLDAATSLEDMRGLPGQCEELRANRQGQLSLRLNGNYRLIFEPADDPPAVKDDGGIHWQSVHAIRILEIVDYH